MRLAKREVTDIDALHAIVDACNTVRLGLADDEGIFIVPMSFGYTWDAPAQNPHTPNNPASMNTHADVATARSVATPHLTLWIHSAAEGRKAAALAAAEAATTPIAVEMDIEDGLIRGEYACTYSYAYRSIMGNGVACAITDPSEKQQGLERILEHLAPGEHAAYSPEAIERVAVWRIDVVSFTGKQREPKQSKPQ